MEQIIVDIIDQFGYIGVFLLIALENIFPPIPSEVILTFSGFMTTFSTMKAWGVIAAATFGSLAGAAILYIIGRVLNTERLGRLFESRLGRALHLKKEDVKRAENWFINHGGKTVFFCRFVPIVRSLISLPAGSSKMKLRAFLPLTLIGTFIWNTVLVFLGRIAGNTWETIADYVDIYSIIAAALFALAAVFIGIRFIKKRFLERDHDDEGPGQS
ncbi:SNARE associated Golgi protein [Sporobacter termitidis DSM 10068]|uniref:SNARE associated Golgi protein n=1 Tax=Sporobacter termitidis DSM 10068 TaxID=1123282 RepID=A0A1M5USS3_9FIRM|nr:DedA family protein [Sporobacter termitidis]SHH65984.1 SNARE associated Golgi protein [Sporobacter termitidis DSM 10068]